MRAAEPSALFGRLRTAATVAVLAVLVAVPAARAETVWSDTAGSAVDAHDGEIVRFGDRWWLYGTSYGCGFEWKVAGSPFCGFRAYWSRDLRAWHDAGKLFRAGTASWQRRCNGGTYGCFRPHVAFNPRTRRYVLWINAYDVRVGYHVFQSRRPGGPFVERRAAPRLAANVDAPPGVNNGDHDLFVDRDGRAYLAYTDWRAGGQPVVERLGRSFLSGTGASARVPISGVEAPSLFRRGDRYYMTLSDPNCGYCRTGTSYVSAASPLGPWSGRTQIAPDSCGGQPSHVTRVGRRYVLQTDVWLNAAANEALAPLRLDELRFRPDGSIAPLTCRPFLTPRTLHARCDIGGSHARRFSFRAPATGRLHATVAAYRSGHPDAPLEAGGATVASSRIAWAPRQLALPRHPRVRRGRRYTLTLAATGLTSGCYGTAGKPRIRVFRTR